MDAQKQTTLKGSFSLFGKGLHTGLSLTVVFNPAPENTGYKIQRTDLEGAPIIDAIAEKVVDTQRGTVLGEGNIRVSTIEHGMAALYALGIDNCLIQVNGPEFPILDGSATQYVQKINEVGIEEQNAPKDYYIINPCMCIRHEESGPVMYSAPVAIWRFILSCPIRAETSGSSIENIPPNPQHSSTLSGSTTSMPSTIWSKSLILLKRGMLRSEGDESPNSLTPWQLL